MVASGVGGVEDDTIPDIVNIKSAPCPPIPVIIVPLTTGVAE